MKKLQSLKIRPVDKQTIAFSPPRPLKTSACGLLPVWNWCGARGSVRPCSPCLFCLCSVPSLHLCPGTASVLCVRCQACDLLLWGPAALKGWTGGTHGTSCHHPSCCPKRVNSRASFDALQGHWATTQGRNFFPLGLGFVFVGLAALTARRSARVRD